MAKKKELPVFYLFIYEKLYEKIKPANRLNRKEAEIIIGRSYNIPQALRSIVLKEMEKAKLIKRDNRFFITLLEEPKGVAENPSQLTRALGCW